MPILSWVVFLVAALLEVGGDAVVRTGLRGSRPLVIGLGMVMLGCYGLVVNSVRWDFSKLLGVYVAVFALVSVLAGKFAFAERVPPSTWIGLGLIVAGGAVVQFGGR